MRILFLTQWFDPEPTPKGMTFIKELSNRGHQIEVLTGIPNYPLGKFYDGYKFKIYNQEFIDGIRIIRVPLYPSHNNSAFKRMITYLTFSISAIFFGLFTTKKADIIYAYHPPNVGFIASVLSFFKRIPFVHDIQDLWPESFSSTGIINNSYLIKLINILCNFVYMRASILVVISEGFKSRLIERGVKEEKIRVIYNWCDESKILSNYNFDSSPRFNESLDSSSFNILFAGNMGKAQNLHLVLDAAKILQDKKSSVQYIFIGSGTELEFLQNRSIEEGIKNVIFLPRQPMEKIGAFLRAADILLVILKDDPLFKVTIPSKIQTYMAIGKPILISAAGEPAEIVRKSKSGLVVLPNNSKLLAETSNDFAEMSKKELMRLGRNGKEYYFSKFSLTVGITKLDLIFKEILE